MTKHDLYRVGLGGVVLLFAIGVAIFTLTGWPAGEQGAHADTDPTPSRDAPAITSLTNHTTSSIDVNWDEADDTDLHWIYSVKSDGSGGRFLSVAAAGSGSETSSRTTTVTGLDAGTEYWFGVLGIKAPSESSPKEWFSWSGWAKGSTLVVATVTIGPDASAAEGGTANLTVSSDVAPTTALTVNYTIGTDDDDTTVDGDSDDYSGEASGSVTIASGDTQGVIPVVINDDSDIDDGTRETLVVTISLPDGSAHGLGDRTSAKVTIKEGVCDHTTQVRSAIMTKLVGVTTITDCAEVTDSVLSGKIGYGIPLASKGIT